MAGNRNGSPNSTYQTDLGSLELPNSEMANRLAAIRRRNAELGAALSAISARLDETLRSLTSVDEELQDTKDNLRRANEISARLVGELDAARERIQLLSERNTTLEAELKQRAGVPGANDERTPESEGGIDGLGHR